MNLHTLSQDNDRQIWGQTVKTASHDTHARPIGIVYTTLMRRCCLADEPRLPKCFVDKQIPFVLSKLGHAHTCPPEIPGATPGMLQFY